MRKPWQAIGIATAILTVSTLYAANAQDKRGPMMDHGDMMGRGGMMDGGNMMGRGGMMGGMSQMMDHCRQMMGGGSTRPNEQWKKPAPDKSTPHKKG